MLLVGLFPELFLSQMSSSEAARAMLQWQMFPDLIYIDASHDAVDVIQDLEHFWFLLSCGGLITHGRKLKQPFRRLPANMNSILN